MLNDFANTKRDSTFFQRIFPYIILYDTSFLYNLKNGLLNCKTCKNSDIKSIKKSCVELANK